MKSLPPHLAERAYWVGQRAPDLTHRSVIYWMRTAVRADENPALDAAAFIAHEHGAELLIYHGVSERYPFASDRHHTFILQGAADVAETLAARGMRYVCRVERPGHRQRVLVELAARAICVVTEDFPVPPLSLWTERLAAHVAVLAVDTACVAPMRLLGSAPERAFEYRKHMQLEWEKRIGAPYPAPGPLPHAYQATLPFEIPVAQLEGLIAECDIDHSVAPIGHTRGGSTAGYARWAAFKRSALASYAAQRNDPLSGGSSRMSAYLHYGQVSPFKLAREARAAGADKFLEELLLWREVAYAWCAHQPAPLHALERLPAWARDTLARHRADSRSHRYDDETLWRGRTHDALWNAAQTSLRVQGELHNNLRMTWGKAIVEWSDTPAQALARLVALNHRFALDGRDPASYGGLYWCLGLFDRPFAPERAVTGVVRARSSEAHAARFDVATYAARVAHASPRKRIAVIGAGLCGAMAARTLLDAGHDVAVFDRGKVPGGRCSSSREGFDYGAQYFTSRSPHLERYIDAWREAGLIAEWQAPVVTFGEAHEGSRPVTRYVAQPAMNALPLHLLADVTVHSDTRVTELDATYDATIIAVSPEQALPLLASAPLLHEVAVAVQMDPVWALMVSFASEWLPSFGGAFVNGGPLSWVAANHTKPGRPPGVRYVLHATSDWTRAHLEDDPNTITAALLVALQALAVGTPLPPVVSSRAHRWRYAKGGAATALRAASERAASELCASEGKTVLAGDWLAGGRVEGALLSGMAAAAASLRVSASV